MNVLSEEETAARLSLYRDGYSDAYIARERGTAQETICAWRKRNNLPVNGHHVRQIDPQEESERMRLYNRKLSDAAIAMQRKCVPATITAWRKLRGLPSNIKRRGAL